MAETERKAKRKPLGPALDLSEEDLARMAEVSPADEKRAVAKAVEEVRARVEATESGETNG